MPSYKEILEDYHSHIQLLSEEEQILKKESFRYSILRLAFFFVLIIVVIFLSTTYSLVAVVVGIVGLFIFLNIVKLHHKKERQQQAVLFKKNITSNEINSLENKVNDHYDGEKYIDNNHHYSSDLDVFGPFSLFGLVNRCRTFQGIGILAQFMSLKPSLQEVQNRKEAIQELESQKDWRLDFMASLYDVQEGHSTDVAANINHILNTDLSFANHQILVIYRRLLPFIWVALITLYVVHSNAAVALSIIVGLINFKISSNYAESVSQIQFRLSKAGEHLDKYVGSLSHIYSNKWNSKYIVDLLAQSDINHLKGLKKLKRIADLLDYRLHMIPSIILNIGFLWDSMICMRLSKWRSQFEGRIDDIFNIIGSIEGLTSLATWSYNHPHFCYPTLEEDYFHLAGSEMRHPLLSYSECVPNDFTIKKGGFVGIITGSNMSGKSTFLRTIGLNIILGHLGTRVAAQSFRYSMCQLVTYMRIKDALEENVSTFKSELNRVTKMLDLIENESEPVFILADEMLRGTNSLDKLKGSKAIVNRIVNRKSYGLVATHDIGLAHLGDHTKSIQNYFFDIDYADGQLVFDYKVKPGICDSFNASFLLEQLGLELEET